LFTYDEAAIADNWVHDWLTAMLLGLLDAADEGAPPPTWRACIPPEKPELEARRSIRDRRAALIDPIGAEPQEGRDAIRLAVASHNNIPAVFDGATCPRKSELPEPVRELLVDYFRAGFKLLDPLGVRAQHYEQVFAANPSNVCPFCGSETMKIPPPLSEDPNAPNQDLDHYLAITLYPAAGSNLRNLVPMGSECNSRFKKALDVIRKPSGDRRTPFDPFGDGHGGISLAGSQIPGPIGNAAPVWTVNLEGGAAAETWDEVWDIRRRIKEDVLQSQYKDWLEEIAITARVWNSIPADRQGLVQLLERNLAAAGALEFHQNGKAKIAFIRFLLDELMAAGESADLENYMMSIFGILRAA